jgi:hypothetical protein
MTRQSTAPVCRSVCTKINCGVNRVFSPSFSGLLWHKSPMSTVLVNVVDCHPDRRQSFYIFDCCSHLPTTYENRIILSRPVTDLQNSMWISESRKFPLTFPPRRSIGEINLVIKIQIPPDARDGNFVDSCSWLHYTTIFFVIDYGRLRFSYNPCKKCQ